MTGTAPRKRGRPSTAVGLGNPIDVHVGKRIKTRRLVRGWTQEDLARAVDLSFQQVQKYERGLNRVSAGRLYEIAGALSVPVQYFYDDYEAAMVEGEDHAGALKEEALNFEGVDRLGDAELSELVRGFTKIEDNQVRRAFVQMVQAITLSRSGNRL